MSAVASPENNWEYWRKLVKESETDGTSYVPYMGLFLSDLTFIKDGGGDSIEVPPEFGHHYGWIKHSKMTGILLAIAMLQSRDMQETIIPDLSYQQYFAHELYTLSETELYKKSRQLEPAAPKVPMN